jgi:hypothetical protein
MNDKAKSPLDELMELIEYMTPTGEHKHKCEDCGHIWAHEDSCINDVEHHTCKCGRVNWTIWQNGREGAHWQSCAKGGKS